MLEGLKKAARDSYLAYSALFFAQVRPSNLFE